MNIKPTYKKSLAGILLMWSNLTGGDDLASDGNELGSGGKDLVSGGNDLTRGWEWLSK